MTKCMPLLPPPPPCVLRYDMAGFSSSVWQAEGAPPLYADVLEGLIIIDGVRGQTGPLPTVVEVSADSSSQC